MSIYMTDEEQVERLKKLWDKYGNLFSSIILAGALSIVGWQWWQKHVAKVSFQASAIYEQLLTSASKDDKTGVIAHADNLKTHYAKSPYADVAALTLAKQAVDAKDYDKATEQLNWVITHGKHKALKQIASLRLARILLAQKQYEKGLSALETMKDSSFEPMAAELRGDLYLAKGERERARMSYTKALQDVPKQTLTHALIQMKLNDIAEPEHHVADRYKGDAVA